MNVPTLLDFNKSQLTVIRQVCAKDCNAVEFDLFLEMCKARGLNPLLRHIYAMVVHKDDPKKRQLVLIVSIDGQRVIAERTKNYRPDEQAPRYDTDPDLKGDLNPAGLISAAVSVYIHRHGGWHPVPAVAYWDEFCAIEDEWGEDPATGKRRPTGKKLLKATWKKMPRVMLAKVAEMQALRKAFPDDYGGLYGEEEIDRTITIDLTASQILEEAQREQRMELIGGPGVMIDWMGGGPLDKVALGQLHDRAVEFVRGAAGSPGTIKAWEDRNRHALRDLWAYSSGDGMNLKEEIEKAKAVVPIEQEPEPTPRPKRMKLRGKALLDEKATALSALRMSLNKGKKP